MFILEFKFQGIGIVETRLWEAAMGIAVLVWQLIIFLTIFFSGRKRAWAAGFWVVWTIFQVYTLPLSALQFFTIWLAYTIAAPKIKESD